jgi:hypothetical protein
MAKTANNNSTASQNINNVDWVRDANGQQVRRALSFFVAKHQNLVDIDGYPANGETRARAKFLFGDGTECWLSTEAAAQVMDGYDKTKKEYGPKCFVGLAVGQHYVTNPETGEHIVDESTGEERTAYMVIKSNAVKGKINLGF